METPPIHPTSSLDDTEDVTEEGEEIQEKDRSDPHIAKKDAIKVIMATSDRIGQRMIVNG